MLLKIFSLFLSIVLLTSGKLAHKKVAHAKAGHGNSTAGHHHNGTAGHHNATAASGMRASGGGLQYANRFRNAKEDHVSGIEKRDAEGLNNATVEEWLPANKHTHKCVRVQ